MMSSNAIILFLLFLNISVSALNQEGLSLLSWLSTFNSTSSNTFFSSWNPTHQTPCTWDYIQCNSDGFVSEISITSIDIGTNFPTIFLSFNFLTTLILSYGNLTGEIPPQIGNLSSLIALDLSFNSLSGRLPPQIGKLSQLQVLSLSSNFLQEGISPEIGNCSKLKRLELFDNQLSGRIPDEIGQLHGLEVFRAGGNQGIHGEIPMQISQCKSLVFLGLADTGISGQIPASLGELNNLKTISVYTANLTGEIPPEIGNCSALEDLFLYENQISGKIPVELSLLKNLKRVLLWKNKLSRTIPESLGNCTGLTVIDFSLNSLTGEIPASLASLISLEGLLLSENNMSGKIPSFIGNFLSLKQLELDNNRFSGEIPPSIGKLQELSLFFAWQNQLSGNIPPELAKCDKLQDVDLSHNLLFGSVPKSLFNLKNLTKLLLISNQLSGEIPSEIGNCTNLTRLRLGSNMFSGQIPPEMGLLQKLSFLELSGNQLTGEIPAAIGNCSQLELVDLHDNKLEGIIPGSFDSLNELNVLDLSMNRISGNIPPNLGKLKSLDKLVLSGNHISGFIPGSLGLCKDLQLLDISNNRIGGLIPSEIGQLQGLDILLNLSSNLLRGSIPGSFSKLSKLANLDLSHNALIGGLAVLGNLDNLASLNVSFNNFSGFLPDSKFFQDLPATSFLGNPDLCINKTECKPLSSNVEGNKSTRGLIILVVLGVSITMIIVTIGVVSLIRAQGSKFGGNNEDDDLVWNITPYQKLNFSMDDIVPKLSDSNIVGKGSSGVVYRIETPMRQLVAVKKLWPIKIGELSEWDLFSAEVNTLGSIRHKNILRLLGCCKKGKTRLLLFDYVAHGSLSGLLHEKKMFLDWNARYKIILGAAHGLAYLHHDCFPPIIHRDIKANNILVGSQFEALLADFGLAKLVNSSNCSTVSNTIAGSYGYIAPEYGYSSRITEKSDVYSYGIVLLEVLTGMEPIDQRIPEGVHIVSWVSREFRENRKEISSILDRQLLQHSGTQIQEMLQVLGVALLCVNPDPEGRPTMKDVTAMLNEIKHENEEYEKQISKGEGSQHNPKAAFHCSSFSRSSEPLIRSPSHLP